MTDPGSLGALDPIIARLAEVDWKGRDAIKAELITAAEGIEDRDGVLEYLESSKRDIQDLEVRWEIDEVIETLTPPPLAEEPEDDAEDDELVDDPNRPLTAADLNLVYDDPRGFMLHKSKVGERWFATQRNPQTGQPQTFELQPTEIDQLKTQLSGSPYWVLGAGA